MKHFKQDPQAISSSERYEILQKKLNDAINEKKKLMLLDFEKKIFEYPCLKRLNEIRDKRSKEAAIDGIPPKRISEREFRYNCRVTIPLEKDVTVKVGKKLRYAKAEFSCDDFSTKLLNCFECERICEMMEVGELKQLNFYPKHIFLENKSGYENDFFYE
jgi:hypothetical protein